jgi:hypothetical protein
MTRFRCRRIAELAIGSRQDENAIRRYRVRRTCLRHYLTRDNLIRTTPTVYLKQSALNFAAVR